MYAIRIFQAVVCLLASVVIALPHDQMVNNEFIRDVGVVYPNSNFTGDPVFLVTHKQSPKCETNIRGANLGSVQICVPSTCILYKSSDCTASGHGDDYYFQGPVDVDNLHAFPDIACDSYMCGPVEEMASTIGNTASATANSEGGHWNVVGR